jgi:hypothetical protein
MRRIHVSLILFSLLGAFVGCHHVAGICDCQPDTYCGCHCAHIAAHMYPTSDVAPVVPSATVGAPGVPVVPINEPKVTTPGTTPDPKMLPTPEAGAPKFN